MKRQRHVFPNREIPHLWAHKTQDEGRNGTGSFYFTGATIYSYGSHFPIATHVTGVVRAVKARGEDWRRNGQNCRLGHYQLDSIEANGTVHAGCHIVAWDEIERIASEIEEYEPRIKCTQCQMLSINGVACHETGCSNSNKIWSVEENDWIEQEVEYESEWSPRNAVNG